MKDIKKMKKSMSITTILMVVMLIVALSTATFAWFTANSTVTAPLTTMTVATSSSANISISWDGDNWGNSIEFDNVDDLGPIMPKFMPLAAQGDTSAQYIATNESSANGSVQFEYEGNTVDKVNVIDFKNPIGADDLSWEDLGYEPAEGIAALTRIYKTQVARKPYYRMASFVSAGLTDKINYDGVEYSYILINGAGTDIEPVGDVLGVSLTDIETVLKSAESEESVSVYNSNVAYDEKTTISTYQVGQRIYKISDVAPVFVEIPWNESAPDAFVPVNVDNFGDFIVGSAALDYYTITSNGTTFDQKVGEEYFIQQSSVSTQFGGITSKLGDTIFCMRAAQTDAQITTYNEFSNAFNGSAIDLTDRFKANGSGSPLTLEERGDGTATTFYIRNDNTGSGADSAKLSLNVTINGNGMTHDAANEIRLAVFVNGSYINTIANEGNAETNFGVVRKGAYSTENNFGSYESNGRALGSFATIEAGQQIAIQVVVWMNGTTLIGSHSGQEVGFTFNFSAQ